MKLNSLRFLILYISVLINISVQAQVHYGGKIDSYRGIKLFQDEVDKNIFYYLPEGPKIKEEKGIYKFHLIKYINEDKSIIGGVLKAVFDFSLSKEEINSAQKYLRKSNKQAFIKYQLPLYAFTDNLKYGKASLKVESGFLNSKEGHNFNEILTSKYIPLQSGGAFSVLLHLNEKQISLLEESLKMETSDLSAVIQGYYPAISPDLNIEISIAAKYGYEKINKAIDKNYDYLKMKNDGIIGNQLNKNKLLKIKIQGGESVDGQIESLVDKLVNEKLIEEMFEPTSVCPESEPKCFKLKEKVYKPSDSLYIALTKSAIRNVPVVLSGNLNFAKSDNFELDDYISVVHLDKFENDFQQVDFKINETHLEAFEEYLSGVSILVRRDTLQTGNELAINWTDIKEGTYSKSVNLQKNSNDDREFQYKLLWNYAKVDTLLSTSWINTKSPFITVTPPLELKKIDVFFDGSVFPEVEEVIIDFAAKLGKRKRASVIENLVIKNNGGLFIETLNCYMDYNSDLIYQIIQVLKNNKTKILPPQKLGENSLINMTTKLKY